MGKLDLGDDLLDVDELDLDEELPEVHPGVIAKNARRRLEDRLEDLQLQKQMNDYDFDV